MGDPTPEFGESAFGSLMPALGKTTGEDGGVDRPRTRRAYAFESNAVVLEQAV